MIQDSAHERDWQLLVLEVDEENAPRLARRDGSNLVNAIDLRGVFFLESQLIWLVGERNLVHVSFRNWPFEIVAQKA